MPPDLQKIFLAPTQLEKFLDHNQKSFWIITKKSFLKFSDSARLASLSIKDFSSSD